MVISALKERFNKQCSNSVLSLLSMSLYRGPRQAWTVDTGGLHEVQQIQVQVLTPGSWQPLLSVQAGGSKDGAQPCRKKPEDTAGWEAGHETAACPHSPESQPYPGLHQKQRGQQGEGGGPAPLLCPHLEYCIQMGSLQCRRNTDPLEPIQKRATKMIQGMERLPCKYRTRELGLFILEKKRLQGDLCNECDILTLKKKQTTKYKEKGLFVCLF